MGKNVVWSNNSHIIFHRMLLDDHFCSCRWKSLLRKRQYGRQQHYSHLVSALFRHFQEHQLVADPHFSSFSTADVLHNMAWRVRAFSKNKSKFWAPSPPESWPADRVHSESALIFSGAEINSTLAASPRQWVGWLRALIYHGQLYGLVWHLDISCQPSVSSSSSCDLLFVSSQPTGGLLGSRLFCSASPVSLRPFSKQSMLSLGPAPFTHPLISQSNPAPAGTWWMDRYEAN